MSDRTTTATAPSKPIAGTALLKAIAETISTGKPNEALVNMTVDIVAPRDLIDDLLANGLKEESHASWFLMYAVANDLIPESLYPQVEVDSGRVTITFFKDRIRA